MDKQTITIYDVAREAAVSMATVSRVVNGNPNVKPATRKKVLEVIDRLDYRPNAVARGLASKKTTTVGVIIPDVTNIYFSSLARGIDDVATMYKYNIILANSDQNGQKEVQVLNTLLAKQVDGIIFMGNQITDELRAELKRSRTPVVLSGSVDPTGELGSVNIDYVAAVMESITDLINNGNKRIAFVSGSMDEPINGEYRLKGYKMALEKAGIKFDKELIFETDYSYRAGETLWPAIASSHATAAFVGDDELAVGVLNGARDAGLRVPEDFEIITSNDSKLTEIVRPKLSSITQPLYDLGAVSMRLLTKLMDKEEVSEKTIQLPYGLIKRSSTK
ncbi:catabolite control protein A [Dellaglioa algida]|uniref:Catabolite control protein A n=1 Tax=Dellaglioa carnosa TaxID=2995136 RepID=A0ABT4JNE5_9LACO|nr:catabolite control protein A [Dellaglioa carnosa]TWW12957.1 catabolite control protein A [Dellaglioa algida]MCZ2491878.1 catabolite control protein A [Dellaglioa carnosa]MCZ2492922.1 catabolite control protein A [Dellaglioa carnosa]MCZ2494906.1 catabolite control protein A [Dellaglioa carnosa]MDK1731769.1 catabolite control protein A [Dellaglioa carnosa]